GWTLGSAYLLPPMHAIIRLYHKAQVRLLTPFWKERKPNLVVSLVPNFNRAIYQSLNAALPGTPLVTVLTDFADYPPHFWIEKQPQYLVCGTQRAVEQAAAMGYRASRVFKASGMILRPEFYNAPDSNRIQEREGLGLHAHLPTGL